ncbi:MAG: hypothetical protein J5912_02345 [Clostridia bacterium]|nr:hypothetical protein [Clostridia bacterium]
MLIRNRKSLKLLAVLVAIACASSIFNGFPNSACFSVYGQYGQLDSNRLYTEERYLNQEIYKSTNGTAYSVFYGQPVKDYNSTDNTVSQYGVILPENEFGFNQIKTLELRLVHNMNGKALVLPADFLSQYVNTIIEQATVLVEGQSFSWDITSIMQNYLSSYEKGLLNTDLLSIALEDPNVKHITRNCIKVTLLTSPLDYGDRLSYDLQPGHYMIYPYGTNDSLAIEANASASYEVFLYSFLGGTTQVWLASQSYLNYSCAFKNMYNNLYMKWSMTDMDVTLDSGGIVGTIFNVRHYSDYYTLAPCYGNAIVQYDSLSSYSNIYLATPGSSVLTKQKWTFIPVSQYGAAGTYRNVTSTSYRCYPYSLRLTEDLQVPITGYYTVDNVADAVCSDLNLALNNLKARKLNSNMTYIAYVKTNEYRVAIRVGYHYVNGSYRRDYHFMEQLSDGTWAHKPGATPSMNNISNPETDSWHLYDNNHNILYSNFYDSVTIIIAVSPLS